jgi:hypothetical protein
MVCPNGLVPGLSTCVNDAEEQHQWERHSNGQTMAGLHPSDRSSLRASACLAGSSGLPWSDPAFHHVIEADHSSVSHAGSSWPASRLPGEDDMPCRSVCPWPGKREAQLMNTSRPASPGVSSGSEDFAPALGQTVRVRRPLVSRRSRPRASREWAAAIGRAPQASGIPDQPIRFPFETSYSLARRGLVRNAGSLTPGSGGTPDSREGNPA